MRSDAPLDAAAREALETRVVIDVRPGGYEGLNLAEQMLLYGAVEAGREAVLRELRQPTRPVLAEHFEVEAAGQEGGGDG